MPQPRWPHLRHRRRDGGCTGEHGVAQGQSSVCRGCGNTPSCEYQPEEQSCFASMYGRPPLPPPPPTHSRLVALASETAIEVTVQPLAGAPVGAAAAGDIAGVIAAGDEATCRRARPCTPAKSKRPSSRASMLPRGAMAAGRRYTRFEEVTMGRTSDLRGDNGEGTPNLPSANMPATSTQNCHVPSLT